MHQLKSQIRPQKLINALIVLFFKAHQRDEKPDALTMKFGNRYRLEDSTFTWEDLVSDLNKTSTALSSIHQQTE